MFTDIAVLIPVFKKQCNYNDDDHLLNFDLHILLSRHSVGVHGLLTKEEAHGREGRRHRLPRHPGGGEAGGPSEGAPRAAAAAGEGALGSGTAGGAGETDASVYPSTHTHLTGVCRCAVTSRTVGHVGIGH